MLFSSWDTPNDACFNSMCNTNSFEFVQLHCDHVLYLRHYALYYR